MVFSRKETIFHGKEIISETLKDVDWATVRRKRDADLSECDWRAVKDRVLPNEWKEYRQALRDITDHTDANAAADNWPVEPDT